MEAKNEVPFPRAYVTREGKGKTKGRKASRDLSNQVEEEIPEMGQWETPPPWSPVDHHVDRRKLHCRRSHSTSCCHVQSDGSARGPSRAINALEPTSSTYSPSSPVFQPASSPTQCDSNPHGLSQLFQPASSPTL